MRNWKEVIFAFVRRLEWLSLVNHSLSPFGSVYALIFNVKKKICKRPNSGSLWIWHFEK